MSDGIYLGKTFKSGNSVALRLPKGLGVPEGTPVRIVREGRLAFRVEPVEAPRKTIDLTGIWGTQPGLKPLSTEDRLFEERALDWEGKRLKRD
ncbi:MAG TPA: AbrB/MazE/SpoVT family DNA-binding domain-containing protein [Sphingobium sp.]|nr:AbrB/MazE/SpoVT family DNA-binding domain-containing protein [Sphingobium sp.]